MLKEKVFGLALGSHKDNNGSANDHNIHRDKLFPRQTFNIVYTICILNSSPCPRSLESYIEMLKYNFP